MSAGAGLVLVGFRGAGKSTVGSLLAGRLGLPFVDSDRLVEQAAGATVAELFAGRGEAAFRALERRVVEGLEPTRRQVVAAGGGAVLDARTRRALAHLGPACWLVASPGVLGARIVGTGRPSLTGARPEQEVAAVLEERAPLYERMARWVVSTEGRTPDEVCDELKQLWRGPADHDLR